MLEIKFKSFTPRITLHSGRELTVEIITGDNVGFSDTVEYEAVAVRDGLVIRSWREHIGRTIVQVLDLVAGWSYAVVTSAKVPSQRRFLNHGEQRGHCHGNLSSRECEGAKALLSRRWF
jgi:hypothetical protein